MGKMNLNELSDKAYRTACGHGFHDTELSNEHLLCLVISELMEAVEADRKGKHPNVMQFDRGISYPMNDFKKVYDYCIKGTVAEELSDTVIRLLDLAGLRNLNINRFALVNVVSKKKTFTENIYAIVKDIMNYKYSLEEQVNYAITQVFVLADMLGIDLLWHIEQKMRYNELCPMMHGKKY